MRPSDEAMQMLRELGKAATFGFLKATDNKLDEIEAFDIDGYAKDVEVGGERWRGYDSYSEAERVAVDYVSDMLEDEPSSFNQEWLRGYIELSPTDARLYALEMAESYYDGDASLDEEEAEEAISDLADEYESAINDNPYKFFVKDQGLYSAEDFYSKFGGSIDTQAAAKDAVDTDGVEHFLSPYDGDVTEVGDMVWYRQD